MIYTIKKGEHYSSPRRILALQNSNTIRFKAQFSLSCLYLPFYDDINKLYGFTDCNSTVHRNSARFGWRHDGNGTIEIFAYWYLDGKMNFQKIGETNIEVLDQYEISAKNNLYTFKFNDTVFTTTRTKKCNYGIRFKCFPYFGGDAPAPQDISIFIEEI